MNDVLNIYVVEDKSVENKLKKVAKRLHKKRNKQRLINEDKLLKEPTLLQKMVSITTNVLIGILIVISCLLCFSTILGRVNNTPPTFMGYNYMQIQSGSMRKSGFEIGDRIVVRSVETSSLKPGDKIAFYVYKDSYSQFHELSRHEVHEFADNVQYKFDVGMIVGLQSEEVKSAAAENSTIVFHEIIRVYEDGEGKRWFKTKGTSNSREDVWHISEDMVIGVYYESIVSDLMMQVLNFLTSDVGLITIVLLPLLLLAILIAIDTLKTIAIAFLELDVVEEKRKLTDEICVKNHVGYGMDKETKYKVLAQAKPEEKLLYISLLWEGNSAPVSIKKYALRKSILLRPTEKLLEVNRKCDKMFLEGVDHKEIAKYYLEQKKEIKKEQERCRKMLKKINLKNRKEKVKKKENS